MSGSHTRGPWVVVIPPRGSDEIRSADERGYLICEFPYGMGDEPEKSNARLIAAAPDLLNALTVLADAAEHFGIPCDAARAAIAKATQP